MKLNMLPTYTPDENALPNPATVIPVIEEVLTVTKEVVETGRIKIVKQVTESNDVIDIALAHDEYEIVHKPIDRFIDEDILPVVRYEENVTIIPVLKEVIVKRTMLVEEIWITKRIVATTSQQEVSLRKEIVTVKKVQ